MIWFQFGFKGHFKILCELAVPIVNLLGFSLKITNWNFIKICLKAITNISEALFYIISIMFCGNIGTNELDAVALTTTVSN
jgi:hypothetical protein